MAKRWAKTGKRRLTSWGHVRCSALQQERLKMAKRLAKMWKQAMSGEKGQASLNLTRTRTLTRVTAETPENG
jgi:hypothetical protein